VVSSFRYFSRITIPDMQRAKVSLVPSQLSFDYSAATHTLLIVYKKPSCILEREERDRQERKTMGTKEQKDSNCNQQ
jgi:hypothetical protein